MPTTRRTAAKLNDLLVQQQDALEQLAQDPCSSANETALFYSASGLEAPVQSLLSGAMIEDIKASGIPRTKLPKRSNAKVAAKKSSVLKMATSNLPEDFKIIKQNSATSKKYSAPQITKTGKVVAADSSTDSRQHVSHNKVAEDPDFTPTGSQSMTSRTEWLETIKRTTRSVSGVDMLTRGSNARKAIEQRIQLNELDAYLDDTDRFTKKRKYLSQQDGESQTLTADVGTTPIRKPAKRGKLARVEKVSSAVKGQGRGRQATYILRIQHRKFRGIYAPIPKGKVRNQAGFLFGHNPFWHLSFTPPPPFECQIVLDLLSAYHKEKENVDFELSSIPSSAIAVQNGPAHAPLGITIDNVVKVIMSQATNNKLALREHTNLRTKFTYNVEKHIGDIPNYHTIRLCTQDELEAAVRGAGIFKARATAILAIIEAAFQENCRRQGIDSALATSENEPGSKDFVPGLLSLDYLYGMDKNELMDYFVKLPGIGVKTTACILAFNLKMPVFAVDVHVLAMARLLKWIPKECLDADKACMFLDSYIPDDLKYPLHQAFWHHRVKCIRCKEAGSVEGDRRSKAWLETVCPLEHLINRDIDKDSPRHVVSQRKAIISDDATDGKETMKANTEKRSYIAFNAIKPDRAFEQGYVLITEDIDNDFGISKVIETHVTWVLKELVTDINRIISLDDAKERGLVVVKSRKRMEKGQKTMDEYVKGDSGRKLPDTVDQERRDPETETAEVDKKSNETEGEIAVTTAGVGAVEVTATTDIDAHATVLEPLIDSIVTAAAAVVTEPKQEPEEKTI